MKGKIGEKRMAWKEWKRTGREREEKLMTEVQEVGDSIKEDD